MQYSNPVENILRRAEQRATSLTRARRTSDILFSLVESQGHSTKAVLERALVTLEFVSERELRSGQKEQQAIPEDKEAGQDAVLGTWEKLLAMAESIARTSKAANVRSEHLLIAMAVFPCIASEILEPTAGVICSSFPNIRLPSGEETEQPAEEEDLLLALT